MPPHRYRIEESGHQGDLPVLSRALNAAGWISTAGDDWDLWWSVGSPVPAGVYADLAPGRWVNHIPGNGALTRKDRLARELGDGIARCAAREGAPVAPWHPRTFAMPGERDAFLRLARADPALRWIRKPAGSARGNGVGLVTDPVEAARLGPGWLVQEYLEPHLIDGYKYTLRFYVAITALVPLTVYVFDDGFTKFASQPYPASPGDQTRFAHLTNPDVLSRDPTVPTSARNLVRADYLDRIRAEGHAPDRLLRRVDEIIASTIAVARERLVASTKAATPWPQGCFELLGLDILVDHQMRPWLIECNLDPSLQVEASPRELAAREEAAVKHRLMSDLTALTGLVEQALGTVNGFRRVFPGENASAAWAMLTLPRPEDIVLRGDGAPRALALAPGITSHEIGGSLALHSAADGQVRLLNATAAHTWLAFVEGVSPLAIADEISGVTGAPLEKVTEDIWALLASWRELGVLIDDASDPSASLTYGSPVRPYVEWNTGATYQLAGVCIALQAPGWSTLEALRPALGPLESPVDGVHHHLEVRPCGAHYVIVADGDDVGPPLPIEMVGAACRNRIRSWAMAAASEFAFEGAALLLPGGGAVVVAGSRPVRSRLVDAWMAAGHSVVADEFVVLDGSDVRPLYTGRETPVTDVRHRTAGDHPLSQSLLDEHYQPVTYEAVPGQYRCAVPQRLAAVLLVTGTSRTAAKPNVAPAAPEAALLAVLRGRDSLPVPGEVAARLIELLRVTPGWSLALPAPPPPGIAGAIISALGESQPS